MNWEFQCRTSLSELLTSYDASEASLSTAKASKSGNWYLRERSIHQILFQNHTLEPSRISNRNKL